MHSGTCFSNSYSSDTHNLCSLWYLVISVFSCKYEYLVDWENLDWVWCFRVLNDLSPLNSVSNLCFSFDFERRLWTTDWFKINNFIVKSWLWGSCFVIYNFIWLNNDSSCWKSPKNGFYTNFSFEKVTKIQLSAILLDSND